MHHTTPISTVVLYAPQFKLTKKFPKFYFPSLFKLSISLGLTNFILGQAPLVYDALLPLSELTSTLCSSYKRLISLSHLSSTIASTTVSLLALCWILQVRPDAPDVCSCNIPMPPNITTLVSFYATGAHFNPNHHFSVYISRLYPVMEFEFLFVPN